jgi:hypothetical protein
MARQALLCRVFPYAVLLLLVCLEQIFGCLARERAEDGEAGWKLSCSAAWSRSK